ncbi:methyltransferase type 11 [Planctomycetota bacterium]|jgi:SAM-dependent methyltransferase|nr:methyltransferase domain-containing protein [Planctomycetota bacterium]GDY02606.1 methyltransferase type 11 [Planctomycetota bacterium]
MTNEAGESEYILGTDDGELARLDFQHRVWSASATSLWERAGVKLGAKVLDVGSGPGYCTLDLARLVGEHGRVHAVEVSERFISFLRARKTQQALTQVTTQQADAQTMILPENSFDIAYCRWVLCFLNDPAAAIARVAAALRSGGRFAIHDYYLYTGVKLAPPCASFTRAVAAVNQSWKASGGDPDIGQRLPQMLIRAGLQIREVTPLVRIGRPGSMIFDWPPEFFRLYLPRLVANGFLAQTDVDEYWRDLQAYREDSAAFLATPPMIEIIAEKP